LKPKRIWARIRPDIVDAVLQAFAESGATALARRSSSQHPVQILVEADGDSHDFRVLAWPMGRDPGTYGRKFKMEVDAARQPDFGRMPDGTALFLGHVRELGVFVGFNNVRFFDRSIFSATVDTAVLHLAVQHGIAFGERENSTGNRKAVVAVRSDLLLYYAANSVTIHHATENPAILAALTSPRFYSNPFEEVEKLPPEDQYVVKDVAKKIRDRNFTISVYNAYNRRCAISRIQLGLAQAAHIFPFRYLGATEDVTNGIALSPNFHKAYDSGLIYLDTAYVMHINVGKYNELDRTGMGGGFEYLREYIPVEPEQINLPSDKHQWPDKKMILKGLMARKIVTAPRKPPRVPSTPS